MSHSDGCGNLRKYRTLLLFLVLLILPWSERPALTQEVAPPLGKPSVIIKGSHMRMIFERDVRRVAVGDESGGRVLSAETNALPAKLSLTCEHPELGLNITKRYRIDPRTGWLMKQTTIVAPKLEKGFVHLLSHDHAAEVLVPGTPGKPLRSARMLRVSDMHETGVLPAIEDATFSVVEIDGQRFLKFQVPKGAAEFIVQ